MNTTELLAVLRLQITKNVGDIIAKKLINNFGSATDVFKAKKIDLLKIDGIGEFIIKHLLDESNIAKAETELNYIQKNNIEYIYYLDDNYPKNLKDSNCSDAPILLFKEGNINLNHQKTIAIVGTRNITNYGKGFCNALIADLAQYNPIIVSGFAYGADICAHKAALDYNLQTIGVFAHGLETVYPKTHKKYIAPMLEHGGFLTEFWHKESPLRENFLKRNRIVAGISKATIVIESGEKGGSLVTADIANSYSRDVFAVPGKTTDIYSTGCNNLIKNNQAHLLTSAEDIVQMLNWDIKKKEEPQQIALFIDLNPEEQKVYDYLLANGKQMLDVIAMECKIPTYKVSSIVVQMELKGIIKPHPGKMFSV